ncbi:kynurenine formamidase [Nocardiopsis mwathae]|uniref:Kynurenine formamidase n=1 Tax=Nocardiopsis mwathae TaxID=1472723 RepID=A0A7W9YIT1_9ACTN|nr:cyclase family protein [Nocardiopsis mwathae]MBB6172930.1 kynurenine formamidase [Nocardiopsis mwathae]
MPKPPHNWGRWGDDDQQGALNLLTPATVLAALGAARDGRVVSLAMPIRGATSGPAPTTVPHLAGRPLPQHFMSVDGGDYAAGVRSDGARIADDALLLSPHGTTTHMDALCHMWAGEELYNGHPAARVRSYGATRLGIEHAAARGVVARGVLLDAAAHRGAARLEPADRIGAAELAEICARVGSEPGPGDVAVVRTGWPRAWAEDPALYRSGQPGLAADAGRWLAERDVVMVAMDNAAVQGLGADGRSAEDVDDDLHLTLLWRHGIHLAELLWLEELAEAAAAARRCDFLFIAVPLPIEGGTGSPINPLAVL